jgi:Flp pilus assembly protein TadD
MIPRLALVLAVVLALAGCHRKEITSLERKEAANVLSEAEFAVALKDWHRAEGLYARAADLCPDAGNTWTSLGIVRMRLKNREGARSAYKSALSAYGNSIDRDPADSQSVIRRAYVLVVLGRVEEARSFVGKAHSRFPGDRRLRNFVENHELDTMIADPGLKSVSP